MKRGVVSSLLAGFLCVLACNASAYGRKFIAAGWQFEHLGPEELLAFADEMDQTPIDGCSLKLEVVKDGSVVMSGRYLCHQTWDYSLLEPRIPRYRRLFTHKAFRHSFLNLYTAPTNRLSWADSSGWKQLAANLRVAARFAKAAGFEGLELDNEDYARCRQFEFKPADGGDYAATARLARQRGAEVFRGVFEEFPDVRVLFDIFLTHRLELFCTADAHDLRERIAAEKSDLWLPFMEGVFDVASPESLLIDGNEFAYKWESSDSEFYRNAAIFRDRIVNVLPAESRDKARKQLSYSVMFYLDGHARTAKYDSWFMEQINGSSLRNLQMNLQQAVKTADEYVMFWGENGSWCTPTRQQAKLGWKRWDEVLPGGLRDAMDAIKDPAAVGRRARMRAARGELNSLIANSACVGDGTALPEPYAVWQEPYVDFGATYEKGSVVRDGSVGRGDTSSLRMDGVGCGGVTTPIVSSVKAGDVFALTYASRGGAVTAVVEWLIGGKRDDARGGFTIRKADVVLGQDKPGADGWTINDWAVTAPRGATGLVVHFRVKQGPSDRTWLDDVALYSLTGNK